MRVFGFHVVYEDMVGGMDGLPGNDHSGGGGGKAGDGGHIGGLELQIIGVMDMQKGELPV